MTSIELMDERADMEQIAKIHSNGNLSKYIRDLIWKDHKGIETREKTHNKIALFQIIMFLFLGLTLSLFALSLITPLLILTNMAVLCLALSGMLSFVYAVLVFIKNKKPKEVIA